MRLLLAAILCGGLASAGDGIALANQSLTNTSVPAQAANGACRVEFILRGWTGQTDGNKVLTPCGSRLQMISGNLYVYPDRPTPSVGLTYTTPATITTFSAWRIQQVPSGAGGTFIVEAWDSTGTRIIHEEDTYTGTSGSNSNGVTLQSASGESITFDLFRVDSTTVAANSAPPTYYGTGSVGDWKLDSALTDGSGNANTLTLSSGSPSYSSSLYQSVQVATVTMDSVPTWAPGWIAAKVGDSFSLTCQPWHWGDTQGTETLAWSTYAKPAGEADLEFGSPSAASTTVSGHVFGSYTPRCSYTSTTASTVTGDLRMGAVTYNSNGVVTPTDSKVTGIYGPMIAFGQNPWAKEDYTHFFAMRQRSEDYTAVSAYSSYTYGTNPSWRDTQTGTVDYTFNGKGTQYLGAPCTTLSGNISSSDTSIPVTDASCLDLSSLPTRIILINGTSIEEVRICSTTGTTGAQTLTVCYDGRGVDDYSAGTSIASVILGPTAWNSGDRLGQNLLKGSGTSFLTTLSPAGAGCPVGPVAYSTGTVSLTASSATMTGSGTSWSVGAGTGAGIQVGDAVCVSATHSSTAFQFVAFVQSVNSTTGITLSRIFPSTADTASGLTYKIIKSWSRRIVTSFTRPSPYAGTALGEFGSTGCESDTQCFFASYGSHDVSEVNGDSFTGAQYSFYDAQASGLVYIANFGLGSINFYGEDLASDALYWRSGSGEAHEAFHTIADNWIHHPSLSGGLGGWPYSPLTLNGGVAGAIACVTLHSDCALSWDDVRPWAQKAADMAATTTCLDFDTRESGGPEWWLALAATYDTDNTWRTSWQTALVDWETRDNTCKRSDYSWNNSFFYNQSGPLIGLTNGSSAGTGTGIDSSFCAGQDIVTVTVTNGSASIVATSGTFNASATSIVLSGTYNGNPFAGFYQMTRVDSTHATLAVLWPGSSGSVPGMTTNESMGAYSQAAIAFGETATDTTDLARQYICKFNSSSSITLDREWAGNTASHYGYKANASGFGQQDFMVGIKTLALRPAAALDSTLATDFTTLLNGTAGYLYSRYDSDTHGIPYASFGFSQVIPAANGTANWKVPGETMGMQTDYLRASRALVGEISGALFPYAASQAYSSSAIDWADEAYGSVWGDPDYTEMGYYSDSNYVRDENSVTGMSDGKWYGFFFGMGMAHQWPAARFGVANLTPSVRGKVSFGGKISFR